MYYPVCLTIAVAFIAWGNIICKSWVLSLKPILALWSARDWGQGRKNQVWGSMFYKHNTCFQIYSRLVHFCTFLEQSGSPFDPGWLHWRCSYQTIVKKSVAVNNSACPWLLTMIWTNNTIKISSHQCIITIIGRSSPDQQQILRPILLRMIYSNHQWKVVRRGVIWDPINSS